jgi:hypothetical protein
MEAKLTFESITQLPSWIKAHPQLTRSDDSVTGPATERWDGGLGYQGAIDMASRGGRWPEGAERMRECVVEAVEIKGRAKVEELESDVTGITIDLENVLAGTPDNMLNVVEGDEYEQPIISIGVAVGRAARVTQDEAVNRGAAIMSLIDDIENQGARVELWAINYNCSGNDCTDYRVKVKDASEHWSPHSAAFALCHAAMNRRLMFRLSESFEEMEEFCFTYGGSRDGKPEGIDVWFPRVVKGEKEWGSMDRAVKSASKILKAQYNQGECNG